jgi:hypothetical protein
LMKFEYFCQVLKYSFSGSSVLTHRHTPFVGVCVQLHTGKCQVIYI